MQKYTLVAVVVAIAGFAGTAALTRVSAAPTQEKKDDHHVMYAACAKLCADCMLMCEKTAHHCAEMTGSGKKEHVKTMQLTADCAEICALSAKLTASHSELAAIGCEACAKACDACAVECEKFASMPEMKACAEMCKTCAVSCREMAKMSGHKH